jgi:hypothetical protein
VSTCSGLNDAGTVQTPIWPISCSAIAISTSDLCVGDGTRCRVTCAASPRQGQSAPHSGCRWMRTRVSHTSERYLMVNGDSRWDRLLATSKRGGSVTPRMKAVLAVRLSHGADGALIYSRSWQPADGSPNSPLVSLV